GPGKVEQRLLQRPQSYAECQRTVRGVMLRKPDLRTVRHDMELRRRTQGDAGMPICGIGVLGSAGLKPEFGYIEPVMRQFIATADTIGRHALRLIGLRLGLRRARHGPLGETEGAVIARRAIGKEQVAIRLDL